MSKDLLKEAIADAKAVRSTAIANARLALEEAFTPKLQSMLSQKIAEEMDDEVTEEEDLETTDTSIEDDEAAIADDSTDAGSADEETEETGSDEPTDETYEEGEEVEEMMDEADDAELEEIIKELEGEDEEVTESEEEEVTESEDEPVDETSNEDETVAESDDEVEEGEELDLDEIIKSLQEEDETVEEEEEVEENKEAELDEAYKTIRFLKSKINEVNLLNSKLLYSNKLFRARNLNESQKMKVIETFDRANSVREVKLVYSTLAESLTAYAPKKKVNESFASRAQGSTKPSKDVIVESNTFATRMQRLAGLK
tara:strand:- start:1903 stop:2844 length:942 start_codon:yes stop_codon:yes gene_type:complete